MQKDMHYYGTYAMARTAGLKPEVCQTIATAAQFVDDNGAKEQIPFDDGGQLDFVPTAHHFKPTQDDMTGFLSNLNEQDQRLVWLPFHFIPGGDGDTTSERLICRKDSAVSREMVEHNLLMAEKHEAWGQYLIGITAHVYADTFSHYGFSGVSSRWNMVRFDSLKLLNLESDIEEYIAKKTESFQKQHRSSIILDNFRKSLAGIQEGVTSWVAETASGALGHGAALTHPDRPYLEWQFDYEYPDARSSGVRRNPVTFLEGCQKLHEMFRRVADAVPVWRDDSGQSFDDIRDIIKNILAVQKPCEGRIAAWTGAAESGELFAQAENIREYQGESWRQGLDELRGSEDSLVALDQPIFRFFQAASIHRTYVLRVLLPSHRLVVD